MKELLHGIVRAANGQAHALNLAREYLQARILAGMQRSGSMIPLAFQGGTALRFLFRLPRFSEDLDFALEDRSQDFSLRTVVTASGQELHAEGYQVAIKIADRKTVHSAALRFAGIQHELGLSARREQVLAVKIEVDTRPPAGAVCTTSVVRRHLTLNLHHHDQASLLAGKMHAILQRPYAKGRDWHDLLWYLADPSWPNPNLLLLNNALTQTCWTGPALTARNWADLLLDRLHGLDWRQLGADVEPFVEPGASALQLSEENVRGVLERRRGAR